MHFFRFFLLIFGFSCLHLNASCHGANIKINTQQETYPPYSLYSGLGKIQLNQDLNADNFVRVYLENGLAYLHLFEYPQALFLFQTVQKIAPHFILAEAMTLMTYNRYAAATIVFDEQAQEKTQQIVENIQKKLPLVPDDWTKEWTLAILSFFTDETGKYIIWKDMQTHKNQSLKFAKNMELLAQKYPQEAEFGVFQALGILWARNGAMDPKNLEAFELLEKIHATHPNHPGVLHYLIHTVENPANAQKSAFAAEKIGIQNFNVLHGLHMPAHHYFNVGDWDGLIEKTKSAWDLGKKMNEKMEVFAGSTDNFHALRWLIYASLQKNDPVLLNGFLEELLNHPQNTADALAFEVVQSLVLVQLESQWPEHHQQHIQHILSIYENNEDVLARAYVHFSQAMSAYQNKDKIKFKQAQNKISDLIQQTKNMLQPPTTLHSLPILYVYAQVYENLLLEKKNIALGFAKKAVELEKKYAQTAFETGPMQALIPANELLGKIYLLVNDPKKAKQAFEQVGHLFPNRYLVNQHLKQLNKH